VEHPEPGPPAGRLQPVADVAGLGAAGLFGALSALRGRRVFHPTGSASDATLVVHGGSRGAPLLDRPGRHRCVVRLSRGVGLPSALPDILGVAVRILDAHGPGLDQDLLLATAGTGPTGRWVLQARRAPDGAHYSSVLPYRIGDALGVLGARSLPDGASGARFALEVASPLGPWQEVGLLQVGPRRDEGSAALRFDPSSAGPGLRPVGVLQAVRRWAYAGSQAAVPAG
jgi:hypothetical protein